MRFIDHLRLPPKAFSKDYGNPVFEWSLVEDNSLELSNFYIYLTQMLRNLFN